MHLLWRIKQATIVGTLAAIVAGGVGSAAAAGTVQPSVTPTAGGPNTRFTFTVDGFKGDPDEGENDNANNAEMVSFWINMPGGQAFRAVDDSAEVDAEDQGVAQASREGQATLNWRAPANLPAGAYTLVAYGKESGYQAVVPFRIEGSTRGIMMATSAAVTPNGGAAGTSFTFTLGGFNGDLDDGEEDNANNAEEVAFWINTPDGQTFRAIGAGRDDDDEDASLEQASRDGTVEWTWQAPADATPGIYTLVAHGLESEREQTIAVEIR
jgi:hypothetical protein